ncbi:MAG: hypothetical protein EBR67_08925, partial [Proteobacteria bacterium]|nr:hypothetical protein [Pseudomonadota bacterium]
MKKLLKGRLKIDLEAARIVQEKQIQEIKNSTKQLSLQELDITKQILGVTSEQSILDKFSEQDSIKEKSNKLEIADIDRRIKQENTTLTKKLSAEQREIHKQELKFLETQLKPAIVARQEAEKEVEERRKRLELLTRELDVIRKQYELQKSIQDTIYAENSANLEIDRARFTSRAEIADLDKDYVAQIT